MAAFFIVVIGLISDILVFLICVEALMSWFAMSFTGPVRQLYDFLRSLTDPLMLPFRRWMLPLSNRIGIDFSPLVAILVIQCVARALQRLIYFI